ncbi:MAG: hypothetical protein ACOYJS_06885 [Acutalibacteraceae bacterium]|jgi:hypothetical protein
MKFPKIKPETVKKMHIKGLDGGLNFDQTTSDDNIRCLDDCKNVFVNAGLLKSRPGLSAGPENILDDEDYRPDFLISCDATDIEININGDTKKMVVEHIFFDDSQYLCLTHFINSYGTAAGSAKMSFYRTSDYSFYIPERIVFYKGAPVNGGGIFAFVSLYNLMNRSQLDYRIFEISSDYKTWDWIYSTYIPTVYINGRGNRYEIAAASNQAFTPAPVRLEKLNILNGSFYAYFSSDGHSSSFKLPFSKLANTGVVCRIYYSLTGYTEWMIYGNNDSDTQFFLNTNVTMHVDREKGIVYFTVAAGDYEIPLMSHQNGNNIRILATKEMDYGFEDVVGADFAVTVGSNIVFSNGNLLFTARYDNPLYFPRCSVTAIGAADAKISALKAMNNKIMAFKENEIYEVNLKEGKALNSISLLPDNDSIFYENSTLRAVCVSDKTGCEDEGSIIKADFGLLFMGQDKYIYLLKKGTNQLACLSKKINPYMDTALNRNFKTFGAQFGNCCIFINGSRALVMEYRGDSLKAQDIFWYIWEFPEDFEISGVLKILNKPWFICINPQSPFCFTATFAGDSDKIPSGNFFNPVISEYPINCFVKSRPIGINQSDTFKNIKSITLQIKAKEAEIAINGKPEAAVYNSDGQEDFRPIKLLPNLRGEDTVQIEIKSSHPLTIGSIDINFTESAFK